MWIRCVTKVDEIGIIDIQNTSKKIKEFWES